MSIAIKSLFFLIFILPIFADNVEVSEPDNDSLKQYLARMTSELKNVKCKVEEVKQCNETSPTNMMLLFQQSAELNNCNKEKDEIQNKSIQFEMKYNDLQNMNTEINKEHNECVFPSTSQCLIKIHESKQKLSSILETLQYQLQQKDKIIKDLNEEKEKLLRINQSVRIQLTDHEIKSRSPYFQRHLSRGPPKPIPVTGW